MRRFILCALALALFAPSIPLPASAAGQMLASVPQSALGGLSWREVGPLRGGRAVAVTGVPGQPNHYYFGAVDGGVWETENAGRTWTPIFDKEDIGSIGAIAVAPSDVRTIYVGTGEPDMRSDIGYGNGMYVSHDGGKTWAHIGLRDTRQIAAIVVDPQNANVVYVAALGHAYGPNAERGVFKSVDGGKTWQKILYKNENTGAISLSMDPQNPQVLYAALWQTRRPPWNVYPPSNGPGSGLYKSTDGGAHWTQLHDGLPSIVGRIGVAVAPSDPQIVYARVDSDRAHGGMYRSNDGGAHWFKTDGDIRIWKRGWYFGELAVDPQNPETLYTMDTSTYRSTDGGKTFVAIKGQPGGDDYHQLWIYPQDPTHMVLGGDQGVVVTVDNAKTWSSWYNQPTAQVYHISVDDAFPYHIYGSQQDSGAFSLLSRSKYTHLTMRDWQPVDAGSESGWLIADPRKIGRVIAAAPSVLAPPTIEDTTTGWEQNIDPEAAHPHHFWRYTWTLPLALSSVDHRTLYFGTQRIFRTRNFGYSWKIVSPDLTRAHGDDHPANLDPATLADNIGLKRRGVVYAIAPSPIRANIVWAGTDDGQIWVTTDGCKHWRNVTPKALTPWSKVGIIAASHFNPQVAYAAIDRHRLDDLTPYIYRTSDGGKNWTRITNGIPPHDFVNVVREDPHRPGLLYAGTERGMFLSFDNGNHWESFQRNLPVTSVRDIIVKHGDIIIATQGRGVYVMDDVARLRQISQASLSAPAYLYAPAVTYRLKPYNDEETPIPYDEAHLDNPTYGMQIDYAIGKQPTTPVVLEIRDAKGTVLRRWSSSQHVTAPNPQKVDIPAYWLRAMPLPGVSLGTHRFAWDLRAGSPGGPLVPPGTYRVVLKVDGKTYARNATLLRDPRTHTSNAELRAQFAFAQRLDATIHRIRVAQYAAQRLLDGGKLSAASKHELLTKVIGVPPTSSPDDSIGKASLDFSSLGYLANAYGALASAVGSGQGTFAEAPRNATDPGVTATMQTAKRKLDAILAKTLARLASLERGH